MADNYLERRMEDYRNGRLTAGGHTSHSPSRYTIKSDAPSGRILVADADTPLLTSLIEELRAEGCRVSFTASDRQHGSSLSQRSGSQFHPVGTKTSAQAVLSAIEHMATNRQHAAIMVTDSTTLSHDIADRQLDLATVIIDTTTVTASRAANAISALAKLPLEQLAGMRITIA